MGEAIVKLAVEYEDLDTEDRSKICREVSRLECTGDRGIELREEK